MAFKDTDERFGPVSVVFHWAQAMAVFGLFATGFYMVGLDYYHPWYRQLPHLHKSVGLLLAALSLCYLAWRFINTKPIPLPTHSHLGVVSARAIQFALWASVMVVLISGYLIPTADGLSIDVFNWFSIPATVTSIENQEDLMGVVHEYVAYAVIAAALLHALAALKHHFVDRDATLTRMFGLKPN